MKTYLVKKVAQNPALGNDWNAGNWAGAEIADIDNFREESSEHRPDTKLKLLYSDNGVSGMFQVKDKYVRSVCTDFQGNVCTDSCVEFFFKPLPEKGYFNLECNCGGTFLCYYIEDPTRTKEGFKKRVSLTEEDGRQIKIYHSMPVVVEPEIKENTTWFISFFFPFSLMEKYTGKLGNLSGSKWTANFYKCGDKTSHPHWASWSPVSKLNFHLPECFSEVRF